MPVSAAAIIAALGLERHPEGGWYTETFRDNASGGGRGHSTAIYFLLEEGDVSA
jgi:predicted cupin superfamily sugar epimerase